MRDVRKRRKKLCALLLVVCGMLLLNVGLLRFFLRTDNVDDSRLNSFIFSDDTKVLAVTKQDHGTGRSTKQEGEEEKIFRNVLKSYESYRSTDTRNYVSFRIRDRPRKCIDDLGHWDDRGEVGLYPCHDKAVLGGSQSFSKDAFDSEGLGRMKTGPRKGKTLCLRPVKSSFPSNLAFYVCPSDWDGTDMFAFKRGAADGLIRHVKTGTCLGASTQDMLTLVLCDDRAPSWETVDLVEHVAPKDLNFRDFGFNKKRTIQIGPSRSVPDKRPSTCKMQTYYAPTSRLPTASIIICFVNEEFFALMRTVNSVIRNSPEGLVREIILVDDGSDVPWLAEPLEAYIEKHFPGDDFVRIVRNKRRMGLIQARLVGASHARGDVLTFLDSHVETTVGWLEPMLHEINVDRKTAVVPLIPSVRWRDLSFGDVESHSVGIFDWTMTFTWTHDVNSPSSSHEPMNCPVMAGGLFSIDRSYFYEVGSYDEAMQIWGGENLEMSFRLWTCGGRIITHPCSIVYHIFREKAGSLAKRGAARADNTLVHNNRRLVEVWLDDFKEIYYVQNPNAVSVDFGNISSRVALRTKLRCKPFRWFLKHVVPRMNVPTKDETIGRGSLRSLVSGTQKCLDNLGHKGGGPLGLWPCHDMGGNQAFYLSKSTDELRLFSHDLCVDANDRSLDVRSKKCDGHSRWSYSKQSKTVVHVGTSKCLTSEDKTVVLRSCEIGSTSQQWEWSSTS